MKKTLWLEICCVLLVLLFTYASLIKVIPLWRFDAFKHDMHNQPFPHWFTLLLSYTLPPLELGIAVCLLFNRSRTVGLWVAAGFMSLFTIYTALVLTHYFPYVPCSCGGLIKRLSWPQHLIFNSFFTGIAVTGILLKRNTNKPLHPAVS